jgi:hypothetical protein
MPCFICTTCGAQYAESDQTPTACAICQEERQYVKKTGQHWTTLDRMRLTNRNSIKFKEPGLIGIGIEPHFGIGQRALFLRTPKANVLWDCLPLLDAAVVEAIKAMGGISAIERIVKAVEPFQYDRVYGAFWDMVIETGGKAVVKRSAERYLRAIGARA